MTSINMSKEETASNAEVKEKTATNEVVTNTQKKVGREVG